MKYLFSFVILLLLRPNLTFTQELKNVKLSNQEKDRGMTRKYEYSEKAHFSIVLYIYSSGRYRYEENNLATTLFNEGTWIKRKGQLILKDTIDRNNLPVTLKYLSKADTANDFIIQIIKNLKGESLTDGFVYINNDSIQCLPLTGTCLEKFEKIDRVKVVFENGYKSKWLKVAQHEYAQILPILQTNFSMYSYTFPKCVKYKMTKSGLKPLE